MPDSSQLRIRDVLDPRRVVLDLTGGSKRDILARLADAVALTHTDIDRHALLDQNLLDFGAKLPRLTERSLQCHVDLSVGLVRVGDHPARDHELGPLGADSP